MKHRLVPGQARRSNCVSSPKRAQSHQNPHCTEFIAQQMGKTHDKRPSGAETGRVASTSSRASRLARYLGRSHFWKGEVWFSETQPQSPVREVDTNNLDSFETNQSVFPEPHPAGCCDAAGHRGMARPETGGLQWLVVGVVPFARNETPMMGRKGLHWLRPAEHWTGKSKVM